MRTPQVAEWMRNAQSELDQLEKQLIALQERLAPVCRGAVPSQLCKDAAPDDTLVPVADNLRTLHRRIQNATNTVQDLIQRSEV